MDAYPLSDGDGTYEYARGHANAFVFSVVAVAVFFAAAFLTAVRQGG